MRLIERLCAATAVVALAGCSWMGSGKDTCTTQLHYESAGSVAPLKAGEGLPTANTKNALKIPDAGADAKPRKASDACLDQSPSFYPDRPKPAATK